jgi:peroxiredoxin Q/BCP
MLAEGIKAPDFSLPDQNGDIHNLADYKGRWLILYFYPKDMTPGCTTEACNFRDQFPTFQELDVVVFGISKDSIKNHAKFAEKYRLPFVLLSDESSEICEKYDVWKTKSLYGRSFLGIIRTTYLINPDGKIAKVYPKVKVKEHAVEVLKDLRTIK